MILTVYDGLLVPVGRRPLHWAVQLSSPSMVQALAKSPTLNPNLTDTEDFTALHRAVLTDKPAAVQVGTRLKHLYHLCQSVVKRT